jgi:hypothetical protein
VGLVRARLRDYHVGATTWKWRYGAWLVGGLGLCAIAVYLSSLIGGLSISEILTGFPSLAVGRPLLLGAGATALFGTAVVVIGRWLYSRYERQRLPLACERRRLAQACLRNLQDAVGYLSAKASLHAFVDDPREPGVEASLLFTNCLWLLQQMLARRQPNAAMAANAQPQVPRLSSR